MNLLEETVSIILHTCHTCKDVIFIGSLISGHSCTWEEFEQLADQEYDNHYGTEKVATDLVIVFKDKTYIERREYDGSEWWKFVDKIKLPKVRKPIKKLIVDDYSPPELANGYLSPKLAELNDDSKRTD